MTKAQGTEVHDSGMAMGGVFSRTVPVFIVLWRGVKMVLGIAVHDGGLFMDGAISRNVPVLCEAEMAPGIEVHDKG
ncbi:MAG TPA: hypothetical protein DD658_09985 [Deltaproteobacteria bacterium]|nr:MAG: hypothetical protein A2X88_01765 [Deltaproteobacteria bacterium GWC2_65_14]HBO70414.1 hypothetical protein [Deltaproteobacteria bacterium]